jgi:hypothetical protein
MIHMKDVKVDPEVNVTIKGTLLLIWMRREHSFGTYGLTLKGIRYFTVSAPGSKPVFAFLYRQPHAAQADYDAVWKEIQNVSVSQSWFNS